MVAVTSWGRLSHPAHDVTTLTSRAGVAEVIRSTGPGLAYGMGRSYGDVCLNAGGRLWATRGLDHLISFDAGTGRLVCEAGVLLGDI